MLFLLFAQAPLAPFALAIILVMVHIFSEEYGGHVERFHVHTVSFSAGLFLGLIFLYMLPEAFEGIEQIGEAGYLFMLGGFVLFHLGEKYIYQHVKNKKEMLVDLASIHAAGFFTNHFVVGITLFIAFSYSSPIAGFIIFIPLLLHTFSSSLSLNHIDMYFQRKSVSGVVLPLSPFIGVTFAALLSPASAIYYVLFAFAVGAMLYISIRDMLPMKEAGMPLHFLTGVLLAVLSITFLSLL